jgi:hypothetical protein
MDQNDIQREWFLHDFSEMVNVIEYQVGNNIVNFKSKENNIIRTTSLDKFLNDYKIIDMDTSLHRGIPKKYSQINGKGF